MNVTYKRHYYPMIFFLPIPLVSLTTHVVQVYWGMGYLEMSW